MHVTDNGAEKSQYKKMGIRLSQNLPIFCPLACVPRMLCGLVSSLLRTPTQSPSLFASPQWYVPIQLKLLFGRCSRRVHADNATGRCHVVSACCIWTYRVRRDEAGQRGNCRSQTELPHFLARIANRSLYSLPST